MRFLNLLHLTILLFVSFAFSHAIPVTGNLAIRAAAVTPEKPLSKYCDPTLPKKDIPPECFDTSGRVIEGYEFTHKDHMKGGIGQVIGTGPDPGSPAAAAVMISCVVIICLVAATMTS